MNIAVVGVTGMVGSVMLEVLAERNFPITELIPVASEKSVGNGIVFKGKTYKIIGLAQAVSTKPDIALFSAGAEVSKIWAPKFAKAGTTVIDNSSAWRMDDTKKLIIPEINGDILSAEDKIIANPNCSTIQMLMPLYPLHQKFKIKRIVVSTYQSVTGTGMKALTQLSNEAQGILGEMAYPHPIHQNIIPHCDSFEPNGYTKEEMKLVNETRKIFNDPHIKITATAVRVPVIGGHSESVNLEFQSDFGLSEVRDILNQTPGVVLKDSIYTNSYPMPMHSKGKDEVFVGRIRRDDSAPNALNLWIVADNLRKGAATNAVQIAELVIKNVKKQLN